MEEKKYINPDTITHIQNYLSIPSPPGLILAGIDGLGKKESAYYIATILLQCPHDELNSNPDFYQTKSNGALKVEDIEDLIAFTQRSSVGNRKVCLIHNASSISNITQNKLLKILEDRSEKNTLIFITNRMSMLPTILSRCFFILFRPVTDYTMQLCMKEYAIEEKHWEFLQYLLSNAPYHLIAKKDIVYEYINVSEELSHISRKEDFLEKLHLLTEKDPNSFFDIHSDSPEFAIRTILFPFYQILYYFYSPDRKKANTLSDLYTVQNAYQILQIGQYHLKLAVNGYSKNDFFNLVRFIIQL